MIILIVGLILLAVPFALIDLFSDKKKGFIYVLFFLLLFQTILAVLTQALGVFYYNVVLWCTVAADIIVLFVYFKIRIKNTKKFSLTLRGIDWVIISVIIISLFSLYQVHYNYTGKINLATDQNVSYHEVKNMVYPYPYFSDEWYAVSLVEGAINNHSLPVKNILDNSFFPNFELFFHSFAAQIMLLLGLNPLLHYTILSIFLNTLIIALTYLFLRINNISKLTAGICSLLTLYITCGANLPGLWHLIPFNSGILFSLIGFCFMSFNDFKMSFFSFIMTSLFYPPLAPFYFIGFSVFLFGFLKKNEKKVLTIISYFAVVAFLIVFLPLVVRMIPSLTNFVNYIFSRIFFISFMAPYIPQLNFYNIIPIPAILLAILGLYFIYRDKKWLFAELVFGAVMWLLYSLTVYRFFIEYERVVIFVSVIFIIISGFGLRYIEEQIKLKFQGKGIRVLKITEIAVLFIFLFSAPFYTQGENWKKLVLINPDNGMMGFPKSPANNYLTEDDIRIFKDIKNKKFLSIPWKGTVIAVAMDNYPVVTKAGTISIGQEQTLYDFLNSDCGEKTDMAKNWKIDYAYLYEFNCSGFEKIDKSQEELVLYRVHPVK